MKLRKFFGLTSRAVLDQVRAELGPDAVIVANRPTPDGIEITAVAGDAMDSILAARSEARAQAVATLDARTQRLQTANGFTTVASPAPVSGGDATPASGGRTATPAAPAPGTIKDWSPPRMSVETAGSGFTIAEPPAPSRPAPQVAPEAAPLRPALDDGVAARLMEEIHAMRAAFSDQLAQLAWTDTLRRSPVRARFTRDLLNAGFSNGLIREIAEQLPDDFSTQQAQQWLVQTLVRALRCADSAEDIVSRGGVYALVGPTGVGKTTTTAKLAARCAVRYGASKLALLTTDSYRVGAHDQLRIYAKILGVAVHTVSDPQDLRQALDSTRGKHLVLIDTVGMSQRDERVREQGMLLAQPEVKRLLLLNAASQGETLEEVVAAYRQATPVQPNAPIEGCVLTKLDEAVQPGQALDVVMRHRLFLHYTSSGQRVPEDLHTPSPEYLVHRALRRAAKPAPFALDDEAMSLLTGITREIAHA